MFGGFVGTASAVAAPTITPLQVQFNPEPLFNQANFMPTDMASGVVTVTNNSDAEQNVMTQAVNVSDVDNFSDLLLLVIKDSSNAVLFDGSLHQFFASGQGVSLGALPVGRSGVFTYTVSFINSDDNSYQGKTLGFDVCVGFQGDSASNHCGNSVVTPGEEDTRDGSGPMTAFGRKGGGTTLMIVNEKASDELSFAQNDSVSATITWDTNLPSTSQVVYGPATSNYTFDINNLPNFGYPLSTIEDGSKVLHHLVSLTDLKPGQTYVYRVVSRASPPTVGYEHKFTVPTLAQGEGGKITNIDNEVGGPRGRFDGSLFGSGRSTEEGKGSSLKPSLSSSLKDLTKNNNLASVNFFGFRSDFMSLFPLIALLLVLLLFFLI